MRDGLLLVADTHINSTTGLCPPGGIELDDGGIYQPSKPQRWLYQCWSDLLHEAQQLATTCDTFMTWFLGDLVDRIAKGVQIVTYNDPAIVKAGAQLVQEAQQISKSGVGIIRGTAAHSGESGSLEEAIARGVGAQPFPPDSVLSSCWYAKLALQGQIIDMAHHGKIGGLPHTRLNPLGTIGAIAIDEALRNGERIPSLVVRAHRHRIADTGPVGINSMVRVIQLPCFQISTAYASQVAPRQMADIGGAFVVVENGRLDVSFRLFRAQAEAAYCPQNASNSQKPSSLPPCSTGNAAEQLI